MDSEEKKQGEDERALLAAARESVRRLIEAVSRDEAELAENARESDGPRRGGVTGPDAESLREGAAVYRRVAEAARRLAENVEKAERSVSGGEASGAS